MANPKKTKNKSNKLATRVQKDASKGQQHEIVAESHEFSGPLPPPSILSSYEGISPGLAGRIVAMAENEAIHRHDMEKRLLDADVEINHKMIQNNAREVLLGQILGFVIGTLTILAGTYTIVSGFPWAGVPVGTGGVIALVTVFIYGRSKTNNHKTDENETGQNEEGNVATPTSTSSSADLI